MGKRVGTYIRELRKERGLSLRSLGAQIGISPSHLSLVERGEREVSVSVLYPIVQMLNGDMLHALILLAQDAGVPASALKVKEIGPLVRRKGNGKAGLPLDRG